MTIEFTTYYGMSLDEAFKRFEAAKLKNEQEKTRLMTSAETPPQNLRKQMEWANRCAKKRKIANDFVRGKK